MNMFKWRVVYTHIICIDIDLRQNCHIFWRLSERFINLNAWFVMKKWKKGQPQLSDAWELDCQYRVNVRVSNSFSIKFVLWNQLLQSVHHCLQKMCIMINGILNRNNGNGWLAIMSMIPPLIIEYMIDDRQSQPTLPASSFVWIDTTRAKRDIVCFTCVLLLLLLLLLQITE